MLNYRPNGDHQRAHVKPIYILDYGPGGDRQQAYVKSIEHYIMLGVFLSVCQPIWAYADAENLG